MPALGKYRKVYFNHWLAVKSASSWPQFYNSYHGQSKLKKKRSNEKLPLDNFIIKWHNSMSVGAFKCCYEIL
jgi:hypothetical protein